MTLAEDFYKTVLEDPDLEIGETQSREEAALVEAEYRTRQYTNNVRALALATEPLKDETSINKLLSFLSEPVVVSKAFGIGDFMPASMELDTEKDADTDFPMFFNFSDVDIDDAEAEPSTFSGTILHQAQGGLALVKIKDPNFTGLAGPEDDEHLPQVLVIKNLGDSDMEMAHSFSTGHGFDAYEGLLADAGLDPIPDDILTKLQKPISSSKVSPTSDETPSTLYSGTVSEKAHPFTQVNKGIKLDNNFIKLYNSLGPNGKKFYDTLLFQEHISGNKIGRNFIRKVMDRHIGLQSRGELGDDWAHTEAGQMVNFFRSKASGPQGINNQLANLAAGFASRFVALGGDFEKAVSGEPTTEQVNAYNEADEAFDTTVKESSKAETEFLEDNPVKNLAPTTQTAAKKQATELKNMPHVAFGAWAGPKHGVSQDPVSLPLHGAHALAMQFGLTNHLGQFNKIGMALLGSAYDEGALTANHMIQSPNHVCLTSKGIQALIDHHKIDHVDGAVYAQELAEEIAQTAIYHPAAEQMSEDIDWVALGERIATEAPEGGVEPNEPEFIDQLNQGQQHLTDIGAEVSPTIQHQPIIGPVAPEKNTVHQAAQETGYQMPLPLEDVPTPNLGQDGAITHDDIPKSFSDRLDTDDPYITEYATNVINSLAAGDSFGINEAREAIENLENAGASSAQIFDALKAGRISHEGGDPDQDWNLFDDANVMDWLVENQFEIEGLELEEPDPSLQRPTDQEPLSTGHSEEAVQLPLVPKEPTTSEEPTSEEPTVEEPDIEEPETVATKKPSGFAKKKEMVMEALFGEDWEGDEEAQMVAEHYDEDPASLNSDYKTEVLKPLKDKGKIAAKESKAKKDARNTRDRDRRAEVTKDREENANILPIEAKDFDALAAEGGEEQVSPDLATQQAVELVAHLKKYNYTNNYMSEKTKDNLKESLIMAKKHGADFDFIQEEMDKQGKDFGSPKHLKEMHNKFVGQAEIASNHKKLVEGTDQATGEAHEEAVHHGGHNTFTEFNEDGTPKHDIQLEGGVDGKAGEYDSHEPQAVGGGQSKRHPETGAALGDHHILHTLDPLQEKAANELKQAQSEVHDAQKEFSASEGTPLEGGAKTKLDGATEQLKNAQKKAEDLGIPTDAIENAGEEQKKGPPNPEVAARKFAEGYVWNDETRHWIKKDNLQELIASHEVSMGSIVSGMHDFGQEGSHFAANEDGTPSNQNFVYHGSGNLMAVGDGQAPTNGAMSHSKLVGDALKHKLTGSGHLPEHDKKMQLGAAGSGITPIKDLNIGDKKVDTKPDTKPEAPPQIPTASHSEVKTTSGTVNRIKPSKITLQILPPKKPGAATEKYLNQFKQKLGAWMSPNTSDTLKRLGEPANKLSINDWNKLTPIKQAGVKDATLSSTSVQGTPSGAMKINVNGEEMEVPQGQGFRVVDGKVFTNPKAAKKTDQKPRGKERRKTTTPTTPTTPTRPTTGKNSGTMNIGGKEYKIPADGDFNVSVKDGKVDFKQKSLDVPSALDAFIKAYSPHERLQDKKDVDDLVDYLHNFEEQLEEEENPVKKV